MTDFKISKLASWRGDLVNSSVQDWVAVRHVAVLVWFILLWSILSLGLVPQRLRCLRGPPSPWWVLNNKLFSQPRKAAEHPAWCSERPGPKRLPLVPPWGLKDLLKAPGEKSRGRTPSLPPVPQGLSPSSALPRAPRTPALVCPSPPDNTCSADLLASGPRSPTQISPLLPEAEYERMPQGASQPRQQAYLAGLPAPHIWAPHLPAGSAALCAYLPLTSLLSDFSNCF